MPRPTRYVPTSPTNQVRLACVDAAGSPRAAASSLATFLSTEAGAALRSWSARPGDGGGPPPVGAPAPVAPPSAPIPVDAGRGRASCARDEASVEVQTPRASVTTTPSATAVASATDRVLDRPI